MADFLLELPKAELHLHLEDRSSPRRCMNSTLDAARRTPCALLLRGFRGFSQGVRRGGKASAYAERLRADRAAAAGAAGGRERALRRDHCGAGVVLWKGQEFGPIFDAIRDAAEALRWRCTGSWTPCGNSASSRPNRCGAGGAADGPRRGGVRSWRSEERGPAECFTEVFAFAKSAGCGCGACGREHGAGIGVGRAEAGRGAHRPRDRGGAGCELMRQLRERDIPLEICLTSNMVTGVVKSLDEHPLRRLYDAGVRLC